MVVSSACSGNTRRGVRTRFEKSTPACAENAAADRRSWGRHTINLIGLLACRETGDEGEFEGFLAGLQRGKTRRWCCKGQQQLASYMNAERAASRRGGAHGPTSHTKGASKNKRCAATTRTEKGGERSACRRHNKTE